MWKSFGKQQNPTSLYHLSFVDLKKETYLYCVMGSLHEYQYHLNIHFHGKSKIHGKTQFQCDIHLCMGKKTLSMPQFTKWLPSGSIIWHRSSVFPWKVIKDFLSLMYQPLHLPPVLVGPNLFIFLWSLYSKHPFSGRVPFSILSCSRVCFNLKVFCWPNRCFCW